MYIGGQGRTEIQATLRGVASTFQREGRTVGSIIIKTPVLKFFSECILHLSVLIDLPWSLSFLHNPLTQDCFLFLTLLRYWIGPYCICQGLFSLSSLKILSFNSPVILPPTMQLSSGPLAHVPLLLEEEMARCHALFLKLHDFSTHVDGSSKTLASQFLELLSSENLSFTLLSYSEFQMWTIANTYRPSNIAVSITHFLKIHLYLPRFLALGLQFQLSFGTTTHWFSAFHTYFPPNSAAWFKYHRPSFASSLGLRTPSSKLQLQLWCILCYLYSWTWIWLKGNTQPCSQASG